MKLSNMFKKEKKATTVKIETVSKTQLEKVIGGGGPSVNVAVNPLIEIDAQSADSIKAGHYAVSN
jgi:hypothetical protein